MSQAPKAFIPVTQKGEKINPEYTKFFELLEERVIALETQNAALLARIVLLEAEVFP